MKTMRILMSVLVLTYCGLLTAQTLTVEERNERIRERWNRSLVDNENYRFNKEPNKLLTSTIEEIAPGKALVVAMGQGRNALALARKG